MSGRRGRFSTTPTYHGRTLKVFEMDDLPDKALDYLARAYRKKDYSTIIFDTKWT